MSKDVSEELFEDSMKASESDLAVLTKVVNRADELCNEIAALDASRATLALELNGLQTKEIPEAMSKAGFGDKGFFLKSGRQVKIKKGLSATWPKKENPEGLRQAVEFLESRPEDEHAEDLLKCEIVITYEKGFREQALETFKKIQKELNSAKSVEYSEAVHSATISKFLRELKEKGVDLSVEHKGKEGQILKPDEIFSTFYVNFAEIKDPKEKK